MENILNQALAAANVGVCIKTLEGQIIYQNNLSAEACGDRKGIFCDRLCMNFVVSNPDCEALGEGMQFHPNVKQGSNEFDLVLLNTKQHVISLLYPLEKKAPRYVRLL